MGLRLLEKLADDFRGHRRPLSIGAVTMEPHGAQVNVVWAFLGGILSFLSPCVLPIIPGYLSYMTGLTMDELSEGGSRYLRRILASSLLFVLGFSLVFTALGASASLLGAVLNQHLELITRVAGVFVVLLGLFLLGVFKIPALYQERRFHIDRQSVGLGGTVLLGMAFGFGWMPCVTPPLAAILAMAVRSDTVGSGALLLAVYSLGLGVPFILSSVLFARAIVAFAWVKRHYNVINAAAGVLLIVVGVIMALDKMSYVNGLIMGRFG